MLGRFEQLIPQNNVYEKLKIEINNVYEDIYFKKIQKIHKGPNIPKPHKKQNKYELYNL